MPVNRPRFRSAAALLGGLVLAATLTGCGAIRDILPLPAPQPERDETTQEIIEQGDADVFALRVGDCLTMVQGAEVETVPVVPCSEPHSDEVFFDFVLDDGDFPGDEAIAQAAEEGCVAEFPAFVGLAWEESTLDIGWYSPTSESWSNGDRVITCTIYDPAGDVTGSLAGAAY